MEPAGEREVDVAPGGRGREDERADLLGRRERARGVGDGRRGVDEGGEETDRWPVPSVSAAATTGSVREAPATCAHDRARPDTRSWSWIRLIPASGLTRLVTRQTPLAASRLRLRPVGSSADGGALVMPTSVIPRATSPRPVALPPPVSTKRCELRTSRR